MVGSPPVSFLSYRHACAPYGIIVSFALLYGIVYSAAKFPLTLIRDVLFVSDVLDGNVGVPFITSSVNAMLVARLLWNMLESGLNTRRTVKFSCAFKIMASILSQIAR